MAFWVGILVGGFFAWIAMKLRFYQTWCLVFNIVISIYLAIYLRPVIISIPMVGDMPYSNVLTMVTVALGCFLILHGISYTFLTGQFSISFPKVFDILGTGFLGFLTGYFVWSFLALLIYITPISRNSFVKGVGFTDQFKQTSVSYICRAFNLVNRIVLSDSNEHSAKQTIDKLLKEAESKAWEKTTDENEPAEPVEPDTKTTDQNRPGPPPEIEVK